jgi:hypothetical protein
MRISDWGFKNRMWFGLINFGTRVNTDLYEFGKGNAEVGK